MHHPVENMRDGSLIGIGKGNEGWNCSAPHGAGIMSRSQASRQISMDDYRTSMQGILETKDESVPYTGTI